MIGWLAGLVALVAVARVLVRGLQRSTPDVEITKDAPAGTLEYRSRRSPP
jgi:hypothetical protein